MHCTYCNGRVIWDAQKVKHVHAEDGNRVPEGEGGDYVSSAHNRAGTIVNSADIAEGDSQ